IEFTIAKNPANPLDASAYIYSKSNPEGITFNPDSWPLKSKVTGKLDGEGKKDLDRKAFKTMGHYGRGVAKKLML
ncbi:MAG: hypothetical protein ACPGUV_15350, partial [Polyangiales bacterium]